MASTSTNKQPLLIDSPLHIVVNLDNRIIGQPDVVGTNDAIAVVNAVTTDGALIEDVYAISRSTTPYNVNLYLSSAYDYLRPTEGVFIGKLTSATTEWETTSWAAAPKILAPTPRVGSEPQMRALYVPRGRCLWAAVQSVSAVGDAPLLGVQGGWY